MKKFFFDLKESIIVTAIANAIFVVLHSAGVLDFQWAILAVLLGILALNIIVNLIGHFINRKEPPKTIEQMIIDGKDERVLAHNRRAGYIAWLAAMLTSTAAMVTLSFLGYLTAAIIVAAATLINLVVFLVALSYFFKKY
jgi:purine-cytosine permease-like protein